MENKLCPMKFGGSWAEFTMICEKEKCAWWDDENDICDPNKSLNIAVKSIWDLLYYRK